MLPVHLMLFRNIKETKIIDVYGGGNSWPAMLDLESKFIESGIGRITFHEIKDFSHGRFISGLSKDKKAIILFSCGEISDYEKNLKRIIKSFHHEIKEIHTDYKGILGSLDLLLKELYFIINIGTYLKIDISKPKIPKGALDLYRWNKSLR